MRADEVGAAAAAQLEREPIVLDPTALGLVGAPKRDRLTAQARVAREPGTKRSPWDRNRYSLLLGKGAVYDPVLDRMLWEEDWQPNALTNDGSTSVVSVYLKAGTQITTTYLGLLMASSSNAPSATTHATDLTQAGAGGGSTVSEEGGGGYTRQTVASTDWGAITISGGSQTTAAQKTFGPVTTAAWTGASGASAGINYAILITTGPAFSATGTLILYIALSATTTINVGQNFLYTLTFKET